MKCDRHIAMINAMNNTLPDLFLQRLKEIIPSQYWEESCQSFTSEKSLVVRINRIKMDPGEVLKILQE